MEVGLVTESNSLLDYGINSSLVAATVGQMSAMLGS